MFLLVPNLTFYIEFVLNQYYDNDVACCADASKRIYNITYLKIYFERCDY